MLDSSVDFRGDPGSLTGLSHLVIPHCPLPSILLMPRLTSAALEPINALRVSASAQYHTLAVSSLGVWDCSGAHQIIGGGGGRLPYQNDCNDYFSDFFSLILLFACEILDEFKLLDMR